MTSFPARLTATALSLLVLGATAGCGSGDSDPVVSAPSQATTSTTASPEATGGAGAPTAADVDAPVGATLLALVGTQDDPEAFEISLTTENGTPVRQLGAGSYTIRVTDQSKIHNFALRGDGVEQATGVREKESPTWSVTFAAGDYTFICEPHPRMSGSFLVT